MISRSENNSSVVVRLAKKASEIEAAQRLRYEVFYEEYGARADQNIMRTKRDCDVYDEYAHHLIVVDRSENDEKIVGT